MTERLVRWSELSPPPTVGYISARGLVVHLFPDCGGLARTRTTISAIGDVDLRDPCHLCELRHDRLARQRSTRP